MRDHDIVHFSCHGDYDWERNSAYLALADGRLYPADILAAALEMDLIVLNACVSGIVTRESRDGDQVLSFPAAFLAAGARQVIGALWEVEEESALQFAREFYSDWKMAEKTTAKVVLDVQKKIRSTTGKSDPYYWGPQTTFGDWR